MEKDALLKFGMWMYYNRPNAARSLRDIQEAVCDFVLDTASNGETCNGCNAGRAVNSVWENWHCTKCMRPIKK
jgi:hypothetical protein